MDTKSESDTRPQEHSTPDSGAPGGGAGRVEPLDHTGVYPVSHMDGADPSAPVRGQNEWGQGERGAAGYADSGESEAIPIPPSAPGGEGA